MEVDVVYMVSHIDDNDGDDEEDRRSQTREQARRRRHRARSVASQSIRSSEEEGEDVEENSFADETLTLAQIRGQMRRQMKEKDKEISHLNEKMTEMMTQMTAMMEMMQKATSVDPVPAPPINHAASIAPAKPPDPHVPQASGIKGAPEGGNEVVDNTRQRTPQNVASASEPVTAAQLEGLISEKIKAIIASEQAEKLVGKGRPYPAEYDQVPYPKGYSVPKFYTFNGNNNNNPRQHIAQFKATCGNTGGNDALLFRQIDLLDRVAKFEKLNLSKSKSYPDKSKKAKASDARKGEAYSISPFKLDKKKQVIYDQGLYNADKGKQPMQYEEKPKQVYTPSSQPKLVLGGNDKPRTFFGGERPRQAMGTGD
ncbi:hypothetical protein M5K25_006880 [Dendrobium thyrsiflorum]|uniref:Uncharacterized protein n=1 Tax=Dendrobium thyrsiflorum TaxID=117978 RepID=A0ABD0VDV1_DENTH